MDSATLASLADRARAVREHAYAPFSKFRVGAALLTTDGAVYVGCNVENRSYGLTICGERHAVGAMVAQGGAEQRIVSVVVVTDANPPAPPCGACREVLYELATPDCEVVSLDLAGNQRSWLLSELLPDAFELDPNR